MVMCGDYHQSCLCSGKARKLLKPGGKTEKDFNVVAEPVCCWSQVYPWIAFY